MPEKSPKKLSEIAAYDKRFRIPGDVLAIYLQSSRTHQYHVGQKIGIIIRRYSRTIRTFPVEMYPLFKTTEMQKSETAADTTVETYGRKRVHRTIVWQ
jgi:hypothetical protein